MNDLEMAMWEAWKKVGPMLKGNPDELKARLARRRSKMFLRPVRAWCLAVRASDRRIDPWWVAMVPEDAADPESEWHPGRVVEHKVWLRKEFLEKICAPIDAQPDGIPAHVLAKFMGCSIEYLRCLRKNGTFRERVVKGLGGRRGKGTPILYFDHPLDPHAKGKSRPDPIWGVLWRMHAQSLREDLEYELTRVPVYGRRLGKEAFRGWKWICPGCKKTAKTLFYPIPVPDWGEYVGFKCGDDEADTLPRPNACFACKLCHGVVSFTRASLVRSWNQLVLHYSGGLLYGKEVKRPEWLKVERKREYTPHRMAKPRQDELAKLLVETDLTLEQIAREMGNKRVSVKIDAWKLYRKRGVKSREGLRAVMPREVGRAAG